MGLSWAGEGASCGEQGSPQVAYGGCKGVNRGPSLTLGQMSYGN